LEGPLSKNVGARCKKAPRLLKEEKCAPDKFFQKRDFPSQRFSGGIGEGFLCAPFCGEFWKKPIFPK